MTGVRINSLLPLIAFDKASHPLVVIGDYNSRFNFLPTIILPMHLSIDFFQAMKKPLKVKLIIQEGKTMKIVLLSLKLSRFMDTINLC